MNTQYSSTLKGECETKTWEYWVEINCATSPWVDAASVWNPEFKNCIDKLERIY